MKLLLIGYMGSGKSLIGKMLAQAMQLPFYDLDTLIESNYGAPIPTIFSEKGEIYFRKLEAKILRETLESNQNCVVALGGGTPCYAQNMQAINAKQDAFSIYLQTDLPVLVERLLSELKSRPLIAHLKSKEDLTDFVRKHLFDRSPYYMEAKLKIKTSAFTPAQVVEKIVLQLF